MSALANAVDAPFREGQAAPNQRVARRARPRTWRVVILAFTAIFYLLPVLCSIKFSLINQKGKYGVQNYTAIVNNGALRAALFLSLEIAVITAVIVVLLVFPTTVLVRLKLPKLTIVMEAITILPIVVPPVVLAAGLLQMKETAPLWIVNAFFNHPLTVLTPMYVVLAMPLMYRAVDTGLRAIDLHTLVDASRSLGAGWPTTL
jgi:putative spermidine/putrescine transport system permease protein